MQKTVEVSSESITSERTKDKKKSSEKTGSKSKKEEKKSESEFFIAQWDLNKKCPEEPIRLKDGKGDFRHISTDRFGRIL